MKTSEQEQLEGWREGRAAAPSRRAGADEQIIFRGEYACIKPVDQLLPDRGGGEQRPVLDGAL